MSENFEVAGICRSIVDGQRGYTVIRENTVRVFHFSLELALRDVMKVLGHADDRDLIVMGEHRPEGGNVW